MIYNILNYILIVICYASIIYILNIMNNENKKQLFEIDKKIQDLKAEQSFCIQKIDSIEYKLLNKNINFIKIVDNCE